MGAFSHFLIRDWEASQSKNFFGQYGAIYPFVGLRGLSKDSIGMCKRTPFHKYVVAVHCVHSAAINVIRFFFKYAF